MRGWNYTLSRGYDINAISLEIIFYVSLEIAIQTAPKAFYTTKHDMAKR